MFNIQKIGNKLNIETCYYGIKGLYFKFIGEFSNDDVNLEGIDNELSKVFTRDKIYSLEDIEMVVSHIRMVCASFLEDNLFVIINNNGCEAAVNYKNGNLIGYSKMDIINDDMVVRFLYDINDKKVYSFSSGNSRFDYNYEFEIQQFISYEFDRLLSLRNIDSKNMDNNKYIKQKIRD